MRERLTPYLVEMQASLRRQFLGFQTRLNALRQRFSVWRPLWNDEGAGGAVTTAIQGAPDASRNPLSPASIKKPNIFFRIRSALSQRPRLSSPVFFFLLFLSSIALGYGLKTLTEPRFAIGHRDYTLLPKERLYDLNALREEALRNGARLTVAEKPVYPSCGGLGVPDEIEP